jgi:hypothetical protein
VSATARTARRSSAAPTAGRVDCRPCRSSAPPRRGSGAAPRLRSITPSRPRVSRRGRVAPRHPQDANARSSSCIPLEIPAGILLGRPWQPRQKIPRTPS